MKDRGAAVVVPPVDRLDHLAVRCIVLGFIAIFVDGFDNYAISYAAPYLVHDLRLPSKAALGPIFSAGLIGAAFGAFFGGYLADRLGRKIVVVGSCLLLSLPSFLIAASSSLSTLLILRAIVGLGVGSLHPVLISLTSEFVPDRRRAMFVTVMFAGITVGAASAGAVGAFVIPLTGWRSIFAVGGLAALVTGCACLLFLPESRMTTARHGLKGMWRGHERDGAVSGRMPNLVDATPGFLRQIFEGRRARLTMLLWLLNACVLVSYFAMSNWLPTLLQTLHRSAAEAASMSMMFLVGGTFGGIALSWLIDRGRLDTMAMALAVAVPAVALIGLNDHGAVLLYLDIFIAGFCIVSVQFSLNCVCAMVYPVEIRASAIGMFFVVGRSVGIVGPLLISAGLGVGLPSTRAIDIVCLPLSIAVVAAAVLAWSWKKTTSELVAIHP